MKKERIVLWGKSDRTKKVLESVDENKYDLLAIVDNNPSFSGTVFCGLQVYLPDYLYIVQFDVIVICLGKKGVIAVSKQLIKMGIDKSRIQIGTYFMKKTLLDYYYNTDDSEIREIIEYLKNEELEVFNYEFTKKYKDMAVECFYDDTSQMWYIADNGNKMYLKKSIDTYDKAVNYYRNICMEQDIASPHRYIINKYEVDDNVTVVDAGAAEGNFALSVIDKVNKLYLIECDEEWIEALKYTFKDYTDRVVFINKYLDEKISDETITIDEINEKEKIDYIKMDIEGGEVAALRGATKTLKSPIILNVCSYHNEDDEKKIRDILQKNRIAVETSKGYMCFYIDIAGECIDYSAKVHKLVRGLVRGRSK